MQDMKQAQLVGPIADVLLLGGGSIMAFILIRLLPISLADLAILATTMLVLAHFVNHPHFAHSYQLFYGNLKHTLLTASTPMERIKILSVAYIIPLGLVVLLALSSWAWRLGERLPLGIMINAMGALVGWHYVKQGFGMAMTDAALKKTYWSANARKVLLINAYSCWILTWMYLNNSGFGGQFWGVFYSRPSIPQTVIVALAAWTLCTTIWTGVIVYRELKRHHEMQIPWSRMPWAGITGYTVALYLWTVFASVDAAYLLVIPFFHSVQYLTVVYRCKLTEFKGHVFTLSGMFNISRFVLLGTALGWMGFWLIPGYIDFGTVRWMWTSVPEPAIAIVAFWLFINTHHYFIDNVLWRSSNPYVKHYLFGVVSDNPEILENARRSVVIK
jgi:hypothetical protein